MPAPVRPGLRTRDDLVTALVADVCTVLADAVDAAWAASARDAPAKRIQA
ncbi:hypothetical protein OG786_03400 [Streptomyces sp. NBC_00101]